MWKASASLVILAAGWSAIAAAEDLPGLVEKLSPSVVSLQVVTEDGREFLGSGFFVGATGEVATNYHVVEGARRITAKTSTGVQLFGTGVLTVDEKTDLAVLKFGAKDVPPVALADPAKIRKGEPVLVIGSPRGFDQSVSNGIVSAVRTDGAWEQIQTNAAISPGSSGSPVVNMAGEVVGVATFMRIDGQSLNFATSVKHLKGMVDGLKNLEVTQFATALPPRQDAVAPTARPAAVPQPEAEAPTASAMAAGIETFWRSYWFSQTANDATAWAGHFADAVDYQYLKGGESTRRELIKSAEDLHLRYPLRTLTLRGEPQLVALEGTTSRIGFDFSYSYLYRGAGRSAAGVAHVELALKWTDDGWKIYKFRERIERR
jgi:hypothetical protein